MTAAAREIQPSSADMALLHAVAFLTVRSWAQQRSDALWLAVLAEVLPQANRGLPRIATFAEAAEAFLAAGDDAHALRDAREAARDHVAAFHELRAGMACEVFRKGKTDA